MKCHPDTGILPGAADWKATRKELKTVRYVKIIDNIAAGITRDSTPDLGDGYMGTTDLEQADSLLVRASSLHEMEFPENLRCIARSGSGFNNIPIEDCARRGIVVFNAPGGNSNAVKELIVGQIMLNSRDTLGGEKWIRDHADDPAIEKDAEKAKKAFVGREAIGRKVGVIGTGAVGSKVANALVSLGMDVHGYDPFISVQHAYELSHDVIRDTDLNEMCAGCDYLTLHVPAKEDTIKMVGTEQLNLMNRGAVLLNYARKEVVDEEAVAAALESGQLSLFITDFATPGVMKMKNTIVTPHMGACTRESESNCASMALGEMKDYLDNGNIRNSVNYPNCNMGTCTSGGRVAVLHANVPNMIGQITGVLASRNVNITRMINEAAGENAYTLVDTDAPLDQETIEELRRIPNVYRVRVVKPAEGIKGGVGLAN